MTSVGPARTLGGTADAAAVATAAAPDPDGGDLKVSALDGAVAISERFPTACWTLAKPDTSAGDSSSLVPLPTITAATECLSVGGPGYADGQRMYVVESATSPLQPPQPHEMSAGQRKQSAGARPDQTSSTPAPYATAHQCFHALLCIRSKSWKPCSHRCRRRSPRRSCFRSRDTDLWPTDPRTPSWIFSRPVSRETSISTNGRPPRAAPRVWTMGCDGGFM